uniref:NADH dehydrogenase subunit 6 n=1 Tax=Phatnoma laciniatum TaxID=1964415 RepID=A0A343BTA1_9HEMI|nr:NADH dehydrogenase subunit 6 [Phatnoma laciniatum]ARB50166.1 NADH dehydrogenase subunit 6 [Phatnoma laciniatum]
MILLMINSTNMLFIKHPISMGVTLIMQTLLISITSGYILNTFWYSYIILLIILSGMLVMFMYMASTASNEKFKMKVNMLMLSLILLTMGFLSEKKSIQKLEWMSPNQDQILTMTKLFSTKMTLPMIMTVIYLFLTMFMINILVKTTDGPMRKSTYE